MNGWICFLITSALVWRSSDHKSLPWTLNSVTSCFGSCGDPCFLNPACAAGERIVVDNIYAPAKPASDNCPAAMTPEFLNQSHCCEYANDCMDQYNGLIRLSYFETFIGTEHNRKLAANQRVSSECGSGNITLMEYSNFMMLNYYCINQTLIATFNESQSVTAPVVYLFNTRYPELMNNVTSSITCTVTPSCISSIIITAIDISFHNDSTGCAQSLQVVDGDTVKTFTCDDNNEYNIRTIHNSSSHFIKLTFNSNVTVDAGKLWIQFNASDPRAVLTLSCGDRALSTPPTLGPCATTDSPLDLLPLAIALPVIFFFWVILPVVILCCKSRISKLDVCKRTDKVTPANDPERPTTSKQSGSQDPLFITRLNKLGPEPRGKRAGLLPPVMEPGVSSTADNGGLPDPASRSNQHLKNGLILPPIGVAQQTPPQKTLRAL